MQDGVHIDFETYSEVDIRKVGAWRYATHPSTRVICTGYAFGDDEPQLATEDDPWPDFMKDPAGLGLAAWNATFEMLIWHHCVPFACPPVQQWVDPAATARSLALPGALGDCGAALGLPADKAKDKRGKYLIQRLCKPNRAGERVTTPSLLQELYDYCKQDVVAERAILDILKDYA